MKQLLSKRLQAPPSASKRLQALVIFMFVFTFANAQNSFFNYLPTPALISAAQQAELDKAIARFPDAPRWVATANTFESSHQNGLVYLSDPEGGASSTLAFKFKSVEYYSEQEYVWYGQLQSGGMIPDEDGELFLSKHDGVLNGSFQIGERLYEITDLKEGRYLVQKVPPSFSSAECSTLIPPQSLPIPEKSIEPNEVEERGANCDIRVLILYSELAAAIAPSGQANTHINWANTALQNSNIFPGSTKFVLAGGAPVVLPSSAMYSETDPDIPDMREALLHISNPNTDLNSFANSTAVDLGADIVVLVVDRAATSMPGTALGWAFVGGGGSSNGFAVIHVRANSQVFTHEVGHLLGCDHEPCDALGATSTCISTSSSSSINKAHSFSIGNSNIKTTIMRGAVSSGIIPHFSNPFVNFQGVPTGIVSARDNTTVIRSNACKVAGFRTKFDAPVSLVTSGPNFACPGQTVGIWAELNGLLPPPGNVTPSTVWQSSTDGVNFSAPLGGGSFYSFMVPSTQQEYMLFLRITVTLSNGQTLSATHYLLIKPCTGNRFDGTQGEFNDLGLNITPNPLSTGSLLNMTISSNEQTDIGTIVVINQMGAIVKKITNQKIALGTNNIQLSTEQMGAGIYFLVVDTGKKQSYQSFTIVK